MLQVMSPLKGFAIEATDGKIGTVVDFLFDDASWKVRWLVVDCGNWLQGRQVLVHPSAVSHVGAEYQRFEVQLTKAQIEHGPARLDHQPVSQQMQARLYEYYDWDPGWNGPYFGDVSGSMAPPMAAPPYLGHPIRDEPGTPPTESELADPHLRSVSEVIGYHIQAINGEIGHVQDLVLESEDWSLRYFVVDTSNWWLGKRVLIAPHAVTEINWFSQQVQLRVSREMVKSSPPWEPSVGFDENYNKQLDTHYDWPGSRE